MAIQTPQVSTNINTPTYENADKAAILKSILGGAQTAAQGATKEEIALINAEAKRIQQNQKMPGIISRDYGALDKAWAGIDKSHRGVLERIQNGLDGLKAGDALGLKQAVVSLAGVTEGTTQRLLQSVIHSFSGDPSIVGSSEKVQNFIDGLQRDGKSAAFKASLANALGRTYSAAKQHFNDDYSGFQQRAPGLAGTASLNDPNFKDRLSSYGMPFQERFKSLDSLTAEMSQPANTNDKPSPGVVQAVPGLADRLSQFLFGSGQAQQQSTPSMSGILTPKPSAIDEEIKRRGL